MAFDFVVKEIERLSQEEGMNDREIGAILGCSRATVNRVRVRHNLDKANLSNKLDKTYVCGSCKKEIVIRRKERRKFLCPDCMAAQNKTV